MHRLPQALRRSLAFVLLLAPLPVRADDPWWLAHANDAFVSTPAVDSEIATTSTPSSGSGSEGGTVGEGVLIDDAPIDYMLPSAPAFLSVAVDAPRSPSLAVDVGWLNTSAAAWVRLHRSIRGGPYALLLERSEALAAGTNSVIRDSGPPIDDEACYQIEVGNEYGSAWSAAYCLVTPDGRSRPLWRAQLRVDVASVANAGTDSPVRVRLNSPTGVGWSPSGNETWIDTPADDFEGGTTRDYELLLHHLQGDVSDVKHVALHIDEDDAVCVRRIELLLNEQTAYVRDFGNATCVWISAEDDFVISRAELRASSAWQAVLAVPRPDGYRVLDAAVTAAVGSALHGTGVDFRDTSNNPTVTPDNANNRRVFEWDVSDAGFPLTLQLELLAQTTCEEGLQKGHLFVGAVDVDAASWLHLVQPLSELFVEYREPEFPLLSSEELNLGPCSADYHLCFTPTGLRVRGGGCD